MVAVGVGDHAEPALEMGEVLVVLAEDEAREPVVVEGQRDLGGFGDAGRAARWRVKRSTRRRLIVNASRLHSALARSGVDAARSPNRL